MSEEEWRAFHANPTIEGLTRELVNNDFKVDDDDDCGCWCASHVLLNHVGIGNEMEYLVRFRELGFRATSAFILTMCIGFGYEKCVQYVEATGCVPDEELIRQAIFIFGQIGMDHNDRWEYSPKAKEIIIYLVDRYPYANGSPTFIRNFLTNRASAASGAICAMYAMKKMVGKDVARMIARVVWSARKYYSPLKNECKRVARFSRESHG